MGNHKNIYKYYCPKNKRHFWDYTKFDSDELDDLKCSDCDTPVKFKKIEIEIISETDE